MAILRALCNDLTHMVFYEKEVEIPRAAFLCNEEATNTTREGAALSLAESTRRFHKH